jgi:hypothetical protein
MLTVILGNEQPGVVWPWGDYHARWLPCNHIIPKRNA